MIRGRPNSARGPDGRFAEKPAERATLGQARLMYRTYLAAVCEHQGLQPAEVERQLARPVQEIRRGVFVQPGACGYRILVDRDWKAAVYARQLALYLANTSDNIPQALLAQATGLTPAAVCIALRAIEDLRDHGDYDALVELVAAQMAAGDAADGARP
jgi:hypothetical protein